MRPALIRVWSHIESRLSLQSVGVNRRCYLQTATDTSTDSRVPSQPPAHKYELFVHPEVQSLLRKLTKVCPQKALPDYTSLNKTREITLLTKKQLKEAEEEAQKEAWKMTAMPPVLPEWQECSEILSQDSGIEGFSESTFVFIDTTLGLPERERNIMVRTPDGTLKSASWVTRDRIAQIFYPRSGRRIKPASHLSGENLMRLVKERRYKYLLDSACCQFEPDDPRYIHVTRQVYERCDVNDDYEMLLSTRHYGPMIFSYILHKNILGILKHHLRKQQWADCMSIAKIYSLVWDIKEISPAAETAPASEQILYIKELLAHEEMLSQDLAHRLDMLAKKALSQQVKSSNSSSEDSTSSDDDSGSDSSSSDDEHKKSS